MKVTKTERLGNGNLLVTVPVTTPMLALILGILSLVLSIWIQRPWCRFLCPLGEFLELIRRKKQDSAK